ncbi:acyl-coenzyme A thioesterase 13 [Tenacibaculum adriaticum]|uniref:Acyl-coenzyme A thioesterase 13 n=1 Tax=Tenacibaculum adriaticum TaxID=413713 RepID=A0A5S5DMH5_9FLAO|nr:PaaI family thioesterase [Tenacibaculum adriaticum]TYP97061.1 acyl-coenzyme A thioesterase 13 [Tenacibaculum adriaticum]
MDRLEELKSFIGKEFTTSPSSFMRWLNPIIISVEQGHLEFEYTVREEWLNPVNNLHGGVTAAIIDDILGATLFSLNETNFYTTINNVIDYFAIAKEGEKIIAETKIIKKGKQFINAQCEIWNSDKSRLIAKGTSNLFKTKIKH